MRSRGVSVREVRGGQRAEAVAALARLLQEAGLHWVAGALEGFEPWSALTPSSPLKPDIH